MRRISSRRTGVFSFILLLGTQLSAQRSTNFGTIPLYFEENKGQAGAQARYIARSPNLVGFVTQDGWTLSLNGQPISMHIADANAKATLAPEQSVEGITNYYLGSRAITNIPHYSSVRAKNIHPGIDIVYHGNGRELEYDLVIHPGAGLHALWLRFEGSRPALADNGDIVLKTSAGEVRQHKPRVWQEMNGQRTEVECRYVLAESGDVGFVLSNYDQSADLTVDPIISYSTYLGGTTADDPAGIAVDGNGYAYVAGSTSSADFPVTSRSYQGNGDVFVTKLNPRGTGLVYSTFIGGNSQDRAHGIAIDKAGNAYVTGFTCSTNFPVTVNRFTPGQHAFVLKLGGTGNIVYSTALAGNSSDSGLAITTGASGSAYVAGATSSTNFPVTAGSYKTTPGGGGDAFVTKLSSTGQISYATYLGGSAADSATAIAVDARGNAYVGGNTLSSNFPTTRGAYASAKGGGKDAFVVKLNPAGSGLVYATYLGGSLQDSLSGLAVDAAGDCYVTGSTESANFPTTPGAFSRTIPTPFSFPLTLFTSFVTKLNAAGNLLVYSTFLGGSNNPDSVVGIAVDSTGAAYVAGSALSSDFPTTPGALKAMKALHGCCDSAMFLTKVASGGGALSYSMLLGGSNRDSALALALDGIGGVYIAGSSSGSRYPTTTGAYQTSNPKNLPGSAGVSPVITKIDFSVPTLCNPSVDPQSQNFPGHGGSFSFNLILSPGCPWVATVDRSPVTLTGPKYGVVSTSPILITGTVPQNTDTRNDLSETIRIGTATFTVKQAAGSCQDPVITPASAAFDSSGGIFQLSVTLLPSCNWTAVPGAPWLSVAGNTSGKGPASISISAAPNSSSPRSTTVTIASKPITVTQSGGTCTATANISMSGTSAQGGDGVVSIATNSPACAWNAYAIVPWIQLNTLAAKGQGSGLVPFIVAANPGAIPRTGQILIADITLSVTQDAGPAGAVNSYSISTFAGEGDGPGLGDGGPALTAHLNFPTGLAFDPVTGNLYIVDVNTQEGDPSSRIRVITPDGNINTFAGGGSGTGENIPATSALLSRPYAIAVDSASAVYISDSFSRVRKISKGNIVTFAGGKDFYGPSGDNGPAINATLKFPVGIAADSTGNVYISDSSHGRVRQVTGGIITTFAGGGTNGLGDNGPATSADLSDPFDLALDVAGNLLISDISNRRVRKVAKGIITTVAGGGSGGDGGPATSASLSAPTAITIDTLGNIFFSDNVLERPGIRKVAVDGTITTIANLNTLGLAADRSGNVYAANSYDRGLVRKLTPVPSFCTYSVGAPTPISPGGGSVQISVTTGPGCRWSALLVPVPYWLTPNGPTTGIGSGTVDLTAAANPNTTPRSATLAIAGMPVEVTQAAPRF